MPRNISQLFNHRQPSLLSNTPSDELVSDDMVGIEVELEGLPRPYYAYQEEGRLDPYWNSVEDGSLRRSSRGHGVEFVFNTPMFGKDVVDALEVLHREVGDAVPSPRTSVHVHLDVRDMDFNQLVKLLCVYLVIEPIFFHQVDPSRKNNPYCVPLRSCRRYIKNLARGLSGTSNGNFISSIAQHSGYKYTALNVLPITSQGSIEFRHKEGTTDVPELLRWINMILSLKKYAMSSEEVLTEDSLDSALDDLPSFVREVFPVEGLVPDLERVAERYSHMAGMSAKTLLMLRESSPPLPQEFNFNSLFWKAVSPETRRSYGADQNSSLRGIGDPPQVSVGGVVGSWRSHLSRLPSGDNRGA